MSLQEISFHLNGQECKRMQREGWVHVYVALNRRKITKMLTKIIKIITSFTGIGEGKLDCLWACELVVKIWIISYSIFDLLS